MKEFRFVLNCETETPLVCGSGRGTERTDAALRRTAAGKLAVPGTSIAGVLRAAVEKLSGAQCAIRGSIGRNALPCRCAVCALFGDVVPTKPEALVSRVFAEDAEIDITKTKSRVVDRVAIDRGRRAAADARKFDYEQLGAGATLSIEVRVEVAAQETNWVQERSWIETALTAIGNGELPIGGRTAHGSGRLKRVGELSVASRDLSKPDDLLKSLLYAHGVPKVWTEEKPLAVNTTAGVAPGAIDVNFQLQQAARSTFLVAENSTVDGVKQVDRAPRGGAKRAELPSESLRGALRSGAERILRTIAQSDKPSDDDKVACSIARGGCRNRNDALGDDWCCLACQLFGNEDWSSRLSVVVTEATGNTGEEAPFDHVAIDRFTGGSRDQLKFDVKAARGRAFDVRLRITPRKLGEELDWALGLLRLTLRDIDDGHITLGHGAARGHGLFQVAALTDSAHRIDEQACIDALWKRVQACTQGVSR